MNKENNCLCLVCKMEKVLLDSLRTQTAYNHFQALTSKYPVLNHFGMPVDLVAHLHQPDDTANQDAGSEILHAVIHAIAERPLAEIGQQLLLLAFTPAIHKTCRELCQEFPALTAEDVAQQASLGFLETARSAEIFHQNGKLPIALVRRFRQNMFRWALREARQCQVLQNDPSELAEPLSSFNFEHSVLLEDFLGQAQRNGLLSASEHELLFKLKYEGFEVREWAEATGMSSAVHRRLHRRLQTIINRLQREAGNHGLPKANENGSAPGINSIQPKKKLSQAVNFSGEMCISNSERDSHRSLPARCLEWGPI